MEIINQNNNFQNSENGTGQNFNNTNISYQVNNYFNLDNQTNSLYLSHQNKYLEYFINRNNSLRNMRFDKSYIIDFYFYFLSNFNKENNFEKSLTDYLLNEKKEKLKKNNIKKYLSFVKKLKKEEHNKLEFFLKEHFNSEKLVFIFDESEEEKNLIKEIENNSQKKLYAIKDTLSFIKNWDYEMYFFIHYLIQTDFELFINSNDDELLFHAIGFLFYSNNGLCISKFLEEYSDYYYNISKVEEIYEFIIKNRNRANKKFINDIILNHQDITKNIKEIKQYNRIKNFVEIFETQFNMNEININEIISNPDKLEEINKIIDEYEHNKSQQEINEMILKYTNNLPLMESLRFFIEK